MNASEMISSLESEGVRLFLDAAGGLRCHGDRAKVNTYLPTIRQHKPAILAALAGKSPAPTPPETQPLTEHQLGELIMATAKANGLDLLDLWNWCDELTIEAIRSGDPSEIRAFKACVESAVNCGNLQLDGGCFLPFPSGDLHQSGANPVRCCDCRRQEKTDHAALIRCSAGVQVPGACGLWWNTDLHQCGQFEKEIQQ